MQVPQSTTVSVVMLLNAVFSNGINHSHIDLILSYGLENWSEEDHVRCDCHASDESRSQARRAREPGYKISTYQCLEPRMSPEMISAAHRCNDSLASPESRSK